MHWRTISGTDLRTGSRMPAASQQSVIASLHAGVRIVARVARQSSQNVACIRRRNRHQWCIRACPYIMTSHSRNSSRSSSSASNAQKEEGLRCPPRPTGMEQHAPHNRNAQQDGICLQRYRVTMVRSSKVNPLIDLIIATEPTYCWRGEERNEGGRGKLPRFQGWFLVRQSWFTPCGAKGTLFWTAMQHAPHALVRHAEISKHQHMYEPNTLWCLRKRQRAWWDSGSKTRLQHQRQGHPIQRLRYVLAHSGSERTLTGYGKPSPCVSAESSCSQPSDGFSVKEPERAHD